MPTETYQPLANITLGSSASSVTFSSIPATFRDLVVIQQSKLSTTSYTKGRLNGSSATIYSNVGMRGNGSTAASVAQSTDAEFYPFFYFDESTSEFFIATIQIMDYSATDKHKTILSRGNLSGTGVSAQASRWASTDAVTSVSLQPNSGQYAAGSTFALYGIAS